MVNSNAKGRGGSCRVVHPPRGDELTCRSWSQEAALRLLMNSLDEAVALNPTDLGTCRNAPSPARDVGCYQAISESLRKLKEDETLFVRSGEPAGLFKTRPDVPRVAIVGAHPTARQPDSGDFAQEERLRRALWGQDAAPSWTRVGSQQALSTAFETFDEIGRVHFGGELAGKLVVSGGMGIVGGIQPLAATMAGAAFLGIDPDPEKITRHIRSGACDYCVNTLDEALRILKNAVRQKQPVAVGLVGNCAAIIPELVTRGVVPHVLSDLTGTGDLLKGYIPASLTLPEAGALRRAEPEEYLRRAGDSLARHAQGMLGLEKLGTIVFDFGNNFWEAAREHADIPRDRCPPGFVYSYLLPQFEGGQVPLRWVALSGDRKDIQRADNLLLELFPDDARILRWVSLARKHVRFQGLPARVAWLRSEQRARFAEGVNTLVAQGNISAPMVIVRDQVICGKRSGLKRARLTTEADQEKTILSTMESLSSSADWVAFLDGENDAPCRATLAAVADGTHRGAQRLRKGLTSHCAFELFGRTRGRDRSTQVPQGAKCSQIPAR